MRDEPEGRHIRVGNVNHYGFLVIKISVIYFTFINQYKRLIIILNYKKIAT